ncbi:MAG: phosphoribosyl-AMP cyclohydrolase [Deltaproteobacteria bacterium]|nr:phosphoribosyl-AMP cyclohydrolase [Candidatus Anaeroferrophillus wilburensis]MBN2888429.1 phosphoribosyl-AMP cyclohydrolase [Deltaproteobacteria bacterium]
MKPMNFEKMDGLITVVAQDYQTGEVLMVAFMNQEAWEETLATRKACYFSRSRNRLWRKGEESGNVQLVKEILIDCDEDAVVLKVEQIGGAACHTGYNSCFYTRINPDGSQTITKTEKVFDPEAVYGKK